jgi:hypothetical protein
MKDRVTLRITVIDYTQFWFPFLLLKWWKIKRVLVNSFALKKLGFLPKNGGKIKRVHCHGFLSNMVEN